MSGSYLEEYGRPENNVTLSDLGTSRTPNTYATLHNSSSRTELLPSSNAGLTESYLHARQSCHSQDRSHRQIQCHSRRHNRGHRYSRSTSLTQSEELKHLYLKVKVGFFTLCVINILVIVFCVVTNPKFNIFPEKEDVDGFFDTGDGKVKSFKLCTKCQPLEAKVGSDPYGIIRNIRSTTYPDFCCFRRVDQLLGLVDYYTEAYVIQETEGIKAAQTSVIMKPKPSSSSPVAAHMYYSEKQEPKKETDSDITLTWETQGVSILLGSNLTVDKGQTLVVEELGYYYIYSHLKFQKKANGRYRHTIHIDLNPDRGEPLPDAPEEKGFASDNGTYSMLQGIFKLKKGTRLKVTASIRTLVTRGRTNYFGIYKL